MIIRDNLIDVHGTSPGNQYIARTSTATYPEDCEIILVESCAPVNCGDATGPS